MIKRFLLPLAVAAFTAGIASATPITGSFSLLGASGTYVTGTYPNFQDNGTAATATGLDFLNPGQTANQYTFGQNGTAFIVNGTGNFQSSNGATANINDILLNSNGTATAYTSNPFITFGNYRFDIQNAGFSRTTTTGATSPTSIAVSGTGYLGDGINADITTGTFNLSTSSSDLNQFNFTFTSNVASTAAAPTPEPSSLALLGTGVLGVAGVLRRRFTKA